MRSPVKIQVDDGTAGSADINQPPLTVTVGTVNLNQVSTLVRVDTQGNAMSAIDSIGTLIGAEVMRAPVVLCGLSDQLLPA